MAKRQRNYECRFEQQFVYSAAPSNCVRSGTQMPSFPYTRGGMQPGHQPFEYSGSEQKRKRCDKENVHEHIFLYHPCTGYLHSHYWKKGGWSGSWAFGQTIWYNCIGHNISVIINGTNTRDSENDQLDADTMHWMNNFLMLQLEAGIPLVVYKRKKCKRCLLTIDPTRYSQWQKVSSDNETKAMMVLKVGDSRRGDCPGTCKDECFHPVRDKVSFAR